MAIDHLTVPTNEPLQVLENGGLGKYDFEQLAYPNDVGQKDRSHFMVYNIRAVKNSKFKDGPEKNTFIRGVGGELNENEDIFDMDGKKIETSIDNSTFGVAEDAIGTVNQAMGQMPNERTLPDIVVGTDRIKAAIALYTPEGVEFGDTISYEEGTNQITRVASFGLNVAGQFTGPDAVVSEGLEAVSKMAMVEAFTAVAGLTSENLRDSALSMKKMAINPHNEQRFKGVPFRSFTFSYKFNPRSEAETITVDNIIRTFRFHAMPENMNGKFGRYFIYPSEFEISFYHGNKRNPFIPRINRCVLTSIQTNFTSSGVWSAFRNGAPVEVSLTLAFTELEILTKQKIMELF